MLSLFTVACSEEQDTQRFVMQDGNVIYVDHSINTYPTEDRLIAELMELPSANKQNSRHSAYQKREDTMWTKDSIYGSDRELHGKWMKAKFGIWAEAYGINCDSIYIVRITDIEKYIPANGEEFAINRKYTVYDSDSIGINKFDGTRGFYIDNTNANGYVYAYTRLLHIGYTEKGNITNTFFPCKNVKALKWKYSKTTISW